MATPTTPRSHRLTPESAQATKFPRDGGQTTGVVIADSAQMSREGARLSRRDAGGLSRDPEGPPRRRRLKREGEFRRERDLTFAVVFA